MRFKGLTPFNEICFSCFTYTVTIRFNEFKRNKLHVSSAVIVTQKMFGYCGGLRAVSLFVNRSAMFVEAVFKSTFGFSYVLFVTVVTLYHVDNVFDFRSLNCTDSETRARIVLVLSPSMDQDRCTDLDMVNSQLILQP